MALRLAREISNRVAHEVALYHEGEKLRDANGRLTEQHESAACEKRAACRRADQPAKDERGAFLGSAAFGGGKQGEVRVPGEYEP